MKCFDGDCSIDVLTPVLDLRLRGKVKEPAVAGYWALGLYIQCPLYPFVFNTVELCNLERTTSVICTPKISKSESLCIRVLHSHSFESWDLPSHSFQQGVLCRMTLPQFFSQFLHIASMTLYLRPNRQGWAVLAFQRKWRKGENLILHGKHGKHTLHCPKHWNIPNLHDLCRACEVWEDGDAAMCKVDFSDGQAWRPGERSFVER